MAEVVRLPELERSVLELIAVGGRDREIAHQLGLPNVGRVAYRVRTIAAAFGVEPATRPQLVDLAYRMGALSQPPVRRPLLLPLEQERLLHAHTAGEIAGRYYQSQGLSRDQGAHIRRKLVAALGAITTADAVRHAWAHQILGPSQFAADMRWMRAHLVYSYLLDQALTVPISGGQYRLAVPIHRSRHGGSLTQTVWADALAVLKALTDQPGFPDLRIVRSDSPSTPHMVAWGAPPFAAHHAPALLPESAALDSSASAAA